MTYRDRIKTITETTAVDGGELVETSTTGYWRDAWFGPSHDGVPDGFEAEYGHKYVPVRLERVDLEWSWNKDYDAMDGSYAWELRRISIRGTQIKTDGTVGSRELLRYYYDGASEDNHPRYAAPPWLRALIEEHRPQGTAKPFPVIPEGVAP